MAAGMTRSAFTSTMPTTLMQAMTGEGEQHIMNGQEAVGFADRCAAVRAVSLPPLDADAPPVDRVVDALTEQVHRVGMDTLADLVILGGSRLSPFAEPLRRCTSVPILEPVAVQMAEAVVRLGLRQSKVNKLAPPARPLADYG